MKKESPTHLSVKIAAMIVALIGVFYLMAQLRSSNMMGTSVGEKNPLAMLFGEDMGRPLNWCPQDVQRLQVETPEQTVTDQVQIQSYCQILTESFDSTKLDMQSFKPILKALGSSGAETIIEADSTGKIFRFQGLPFGSRQLLHQLEKKNRR